MDLEECEDLVEEFANEHGLAALYDKMIIPALGLAEQDRHAGALDEEHSRFIFDTTRHIVEYIEDRSEKKEIPAANVINRPAPPLCIVGAHDEADHLAGAMLARMLAAPEFNPRLVPFPLLAAETLEQIAEQGCKLVCISAVPPQAGVHAAYLAKRLRSRFPELKIVVVLWGGQNVERFRARLRTLGVDQVVTRLAEALDKLRELQQYKTRPKSGSEPDSKPEQTASRRA